MIITTRLSNVEHEGGSKTLEPPFMWDATRRLNGGRHKSCFVDGVTADSLNAHLRTYRRTPST